MSTPKQPRQSDAGQATPPEAREGTPGSREEEPEERVLGLTDILGREAGGLLVLLVLIAALTIATETFLTGTNLANLVRQVTVFAVLAVGQLFVILTAGIDLSVGSVLALSGAVTAQMLVAGVPVPVAAVLGIIIGLLLGVFNGVLVAFFGIPPFITTLGMLGMARGMVLLITDARTISGLPESFQVIANGSVLGVPNLLVALLIVGVVATFVLGRTVFGRYVYAVGSNAESARLSGVPVTRVLVTVYAISGLLAGVAGVLIASRLGAGIPTAGTGYELQAIAGAVIGGASLSGAKGRALGAILGALIMATLENGGNLLGVDPFYLQIAIGALILIAVFFDQVQQRGLRFGRASA
ncbi:MAG: Ribose ABC transport system, permease protein RbsC [uncultured Rubrobacteraceae bacterium]|uniref:Ribose ABC transport system, permease protein RbsC n=1 Tax=uncultured Rubrobacteraceae bacterium TaxID=349277 RepID=A0A6J4QDU9_9ACTN|nr:MAG: Ribose ABC transport system, permease protein RbsC [uncultured Rubrobacteraceae bacterium]